VALIPLGAGVLLLRVVVLHQQHFESAQTPSLQRRKQQLFVIQAAGSHGAHGGNQHLRVAVLADVSGGASKRPPAPRDARGLVDCAF
jgi:hypothetical protein